jgi:phosphomevalonate kinase
MIATAPGKLILTGEYAVLDGAPALVIAVDRRVIARRNVGPRGSSEFLLAIVDEIIARKGKDHPAARAATEIVVDSSAFYVPAASSRSAARARRSTGSSPAIDVSVGMPGAQKLGIGSSAAVTVAATALALAADCETMPVIDREEVLAIASAAHAAAQGPRGARGSGADIASAVFGGVIAYQRETPDRVAWPIDAADRDRANTLTGGTADQLSWPAGVTLVPFFTGTSADTPTLVAAVQAARERDPVAVDAALKAIDQASRAACQACATRVPEIAANAFLSALSLAASATERLAGATGVSLVPGCVTAARAAMARLRGTAKTTGAGGGDIGIAVIPSTEDVTEAKRLLIEAGCQPLALGVDRTGVDLQPDAK